MPDLLQTKEWGDCVIDNVPTLRCIWPLFDNIINAAIGFAGIVALYFIIFGGIRFITSRGDAEAIQNARSTIIFAIIGLVFVLLSFFVFNFILNTAGIDPASLILPGNIE